MIYCTENRSQLSYIICIIASRYFSVHYRLDLNNLQHCLLLLLLLWTYWALVYCAVLCVLTLSVFKSPDQYTCSVLYSVTCVHSNHLETFGKFYNWLVQALTDTSSWWTDGGGFPKNFLLVICVCVWLYYKYKYLLNLHPY